MYHAQYGSRAMPQAPRAATSRACSPDLDSDPYTGLNAQADQRKREVELQNESTFMSPGATDVRNTKQRDELAKLLAVPEQQGANALALEQEKQRGEMASAAAGSRILLVS
jgi:hypothetical protein